MEKREVSIIRTALRRVEGHEPGAPTEEFRQSRAAMATPSSPAFAKSGSTATAGLFAGPTGPGPSVPTVGTLPDDAEGPLLGWAACRSPRVAGEFGRRDGRR